MICYLGLGSNLNQPAAQIQAALKALDRLPDSHLTMCSALYRSRPVGPQDQPDFINAVAALDTRLEPAALLKELQRLEQEAGRVRQRHWGERTLDLDILLCEDRIIDQPDLQVPHPRLCERPFVLIPLYDIAPALTLPDGSQLADHWQRCNKEGVWYHGPATPREDRP